MKSRALLKIGICVVSLLLPMQLFAVGPQDISKTLHNLGSEGDSPLTAATMDEVCVFCHTPHNSSNELPLWNRYSSSGSKVFLMYTASSTLTSEVKGNVGLSANSPSRLCLSCHDGTTAVNALVNLAATGGIRPIMDDIFADSFSDKPGIWTEGVGPYLGTNLVNMHPINFSYEKAQEEDAELYVIADVKTAGLKFFDDNRDGTADYMECATCHDPHVNYNWVGVEVDRGGDLRYRPFLRKPNKSSALCLTCHNK